MKYTVYASQAEEVAKRLNRIANKAAKYNVPFSYTVSCVHPQQVAVKTIGPDCRTAETIHTYTVEAVDFDINCEELIRANGWTVCAKIEHGDKGNIVTPFGDAVVDEAWYTVPARCDHCGTNRARSVTFMCRNENGDVRQVGRSCLKDYTGIFPGAAVLWAEVTEIFPDGLDCTEDELVSRGVVKLIDVDHILALACDSIKAHGYVKSDNPGSTRGEVLGLLNTEPSLEGKEKAKAIIAWLVRLLDEEPNTIGIERDCVSLAKSGFAKTHHIGRLAYMPLAYDRYIERKEREAKLIAEAEATRNSSEYVGEIGKRMEFNIADMKLLSSWETQYGTTYLYKFTTTDGNVLIWFASSTFGEWTKDGRRWIAFESVSKIKATVKDHNERDGVKQTIITRCKAS